MTHFIRANFNNEPQDKIKLKYDFNIRDELFQDQKGYELLFKYVYKYSSENPKNKIITIAENQTVSVANIMALNKRSENEHKKLFVIWIDLYPDSSTSFQLFEDCKILKTEQYLNKENIIYLGLEDKSESLDQVQEDEMLFFTMKKIKSIGIQKIINSIKHIIGDNFVHVSLDLKVMLQKEDMSLDLNEIKEIFTLLKENIISTDITEFVLEQLKDQDKEQKKICNLIKQILIDNFDIKEKRLNIFSEESEFLIYRPQYITDLESDIGWYILRGLNLTEREQLLNQIGEDKIITLEIPDENQEEKIYWITKTTMQEQNRKSYYTSRSIYDCSLFPEEKKLMCFELLHA